MDEGNMESQLDLYGPELLNSINCSVLPPHKLILKVGVPVMLLRNIDQSSGLCNGIRLQVRKLGNHVIEREVLTGNNVSHIALIPRMNMVPTNETVPVRFQRRQFPIIVSFAMTINKSQGQTLSHVGLYLPKPVFTHGQLYVALSGVKTKRDLKVLLMNHIEMSANSTINVVYREVFEKIVF
ncbi:ATP-dependent DNA helicase PIF6-like [Arachis ipaensis]|uniref:ATP-dependent DNA helicase PIF6-like n=1 Tax=Arachis ipaensis TaxID=130454 RepID=UPI0007AF0D26|nr:ATP-dependent DNA helicase PIF6-like [Arachis ipaensis]